MRHYFERAEALQVAPRPAPTALTAPLAGRARGRSASRLTYQELAQPSRARNLLVWCIALVCRQRRLSRPNPSRSKTIYREIIGSARGRPGREMESCTTCSRPNKPLSRPEPNQQTRVTRQTSIGATLGPSRVGSVSSAASRGTLLPNAGKDAITDAHTG